jgi:lysophospholipase L1-like esterase
VTPALNFGVNGDTTTQMLARIGPVLASAADTVIFLGGTNDYNDGSVTLAQTLSNLAAIRDLILAANKRLIMIAELPRGDSTFTSFRLTTNLPKAFAVHQAILSWQGVYRGLYVVDAWPSLGLYNSTTGDAIPGMLYDGLHQSPSGAYWIAKALQPTIENLFPPRPLSPASNSDQYDVTLNQRGCLNTNPMVDGTGGTASSGATGAVATGYTLFGETGVTVTGSKVTDGNGLVWQQIAISGTPSGASPFVELRQVLTLSKFAAGDVLQQSLEVQVDAGGAGYTGLQNAILTIVGGTTTYAVDGDQFNTAAIGPSFAFSGVSLTPTVTLLSTPSITNVYSQFKVQLVQNIAAALTVRVRAIATRKVV